jgi:hypothetical protein
MTWNKKRKKRQPGKNKDCSLSKKLREDGKTSDEFEVMLHSLSLEEVIGLKLELAAKSAGSMFYGMSIWKSVPTIARDAVLKYAYSATRTKAEAARFLGVNLEDFKKLLKKYRTEEYFDLK